jgi:signal peptide peptidase SppA
MTMHFLAQCLSTPWAMTPEAMRAYASILAQRYSGRRAGGMDEDDHGAPLKEPKAAVSRAGNARSGVIAVVPVRGAIMEHASDFGPCEGGTSADQVSAALRQANADESVSGILLDINSPGGSVYGIAELAAEVRASAKPVTAIARSLAASAAYWLGTAASEFFVTPGGEVGSIGVWMAHEDMSKALEEKGVNVTLISAGKYKVEGHPFGPLDPDARAFLQSRTDDYYGAFTRDVAKGRGVSVDAVRGGMGQGRVLGADQAIAEKMVDGKMTFDQVVRHMQKSMKPAPARSASLAAQQRRLDIAELEG